MNSNYIYEAKAYNEAGEHIGMGAWIDHIHAANKIDAEFFGSPEHSKTLDGDYMEIYPHARVVFLRNKPDVVDMVRIVATDDYGEGVLARAYMMREAE